MFLTNEDGPGNDGALRSLRHGLRLSFDLRNFYVLMHFTIVAQPLLWTDESPRRSFYDERIKSSYLLSRKLPDRSAALVILLLLLLLEKKLEVLIC